MDLKTRHELLQLCESYKHCLVIVEGPRDKEALTALGFKNIITLNKPLFKLIEAIKENEVIILTDLDRAGKKLYSILRNELTSRNIKVNDRIRNFLFKTRYRQIQGLVNIVKDCC